MSDGAAAAGAITFLVKPVDPEALLPPVKAALQRATEWRRFESARCVLDRVEQQLVDDQPDVDRVVRIQMQIGPARLGGDLHVRPRHACQGLRDLPHHVDRGHARRSLLAQQAESDRHREQLQHGRLDGLGDLGTRGGMGTQQPHDALQSVLHAMVHLADERLAQPALGFEPLLFDMDRLRDVDDDRVERFREAADAASPGYERGLGVRFEIGFSVQGEATDTIAARIRRSKRLKVTETSFVASGSGDCAPPSRSDG